MLPAMLFSFCGKNYFCNSYFVTVFSGRSAKIHHFQKTFEGFHFENQQREGVCVCAELRQRPCRESCCQHSSALGSRCSQYQAVGPLQIGFVCSRGKAVPQDQGNALSWLIQGQGGFIPSKSVLELRDRNENGNLIHQRCVP